MFEVAYLLMKLFFISCFIGASGGVYAYYGGKENLREVLAIEARFEAVVDRLEKMVGALSKTDGGAVSREGGSSDASVKTK